MPISGKHRRPKSSTIARGVAAVGAGGAVIALPLLGATGAHAAEQAAPAAHSAAAPAAPVAKKQSETRTYSVVAGDYLSKIAADNKVEGGWEKLYQDNREVIGGNPSLIHPGMKLTLGGPAAATGTTPAAPAPSTTPAVTKPAPAQSSSSGYVAPVPGKHTTNYRASGANWSSGSHTGIDFPVSTGTSVKAITSGTVVTAGWGGAYGNEVVVKHADGHYSQYGHLSALSVSVGQTLSTGQQIGLSGATGNVTGPHLHFEVRTGPAYGSDIDPVAFLASHGISV
ncbi:MULTISPECIES: LysM peptidoglycan-binding domain-containing M23 family metallopeptidase [unclassified Streptomyces]|jgi:murein DD-endopeptidase MepM/ murein hydrolase activator NlpD|uniref:M23 family metallopeptidase n=1 Tax=unclassified Streptomyces TaxID=2593676 RepID=UPI0029ABD51B|nr:MULTISPECIES: LysM peptidoglycan-binding domain-containing M23 family metallopeptidase [unclassified Streptomyces]MDX3768635.1 LysM peptidoglycan-binding domain-containing M23 family metallopeptidase [Streptomyces sp. AK08-01B]MDX3818569.1 LysM peptidoglycan-binding domain-containing M23 family metallopeptidase [Streptomyces sp. AK08-01A]